jgi:hypothetical protein
MGDDWPAKRSYSEGSAWRAQFGGEGGIRTRDTLSGIHTFQACSFNHSDTSPKKRTKKWINISITKGGQR